MTKEEAIWILENRTVTGELKSRVGGYTDLYDFCLEALKQTSAQPQSTMGQVTDAVQSTKDCISRQAAIDALGEKPLVWDDLSDFDLGKAAQWSDDVDAIKALPSAQPEQRWIPCDETVEIPDHEVLACDKYGEEILGYLGYADDQWICESDSEVMYDPIAWMEKPEPYKGEQ